MGRSSFTVAPASAPAGWNGKLPRPCPRLSCSGRSSAAPSRSRSSPASPTSSPSTSTPPPSSGRASSSTTPRSAWPRIHTFIATSDIHMQHKLRKMPDQVVAIAREMVAYARSLGCTDVEFSPEDAGRSNREFLYHILGKVIKARATTLNILDTVGYNLPYEFRKLIADINKANALGLENAIISTQGQNDLGLATANTLAGARAGARQLEVTINSIGERAVNASLEEVVMAIKCRRELLDGLYTGIDSRHITLTSKMVQEHSGLHVQRHKAIVGANVFAHESGIHQDGMLKYKGTYEIISPDDICLTRGNEFGIVLGKLSGRHASRR